MRPTVFGLLLPQNLYVGLALQYKRRRVVALQNQLSPNAEVIL